MILGVDTGGTFTDFALFSLESQTSTIRTHKVLSTPDAPERAILQGIQEMGLAESIAAGKMRIVHGTTVATNAALEGKGVKTAFITNRGFKDMLSIGRQTRPLLYQLESPPQQIPVPTELCLEVSGRIDAKGNVLEDMDAEDLKNLTQQLEALKPEAIAINLLFSFLDNNHEKRLEAYLLQHLSWKPYICRSSFVLPEYKEYERGISTWLNASLGPLVRKYLLELKAATQPSSLSIMQSSGGTINADLAAEKSVNLLLSGPAGGLAAASFLAHSLNKLRLMTFDMGGTSTDVALLPDGTINLGSEGKIGPFPVSVPMVDMHTIGAGGGSIAYVDDGDLLKVGPQSSGAKPGPACYGLGGRQATVTDANLVLGRLLPDAFLGGTLSLDAEASLSVITDISKKLALTTKQAASGIIQVANEHMARALRVISVERGYDPKDFCLCSFGGAGGLHLCALADALEMNTALVPVHAGVLSALGMFMAPIERQLSISHQCLMKDINNQNLNKIIDNLRFDAETQVAQEVGDSVKVSVKVSADLRYAGQSAYLNLPWCNPEQLEQAFHHAHQARYGHRLANELELVNIRVAARAQALDHQLAKLLNTSNSTPAKMINLYGYAEKIPVFERAVLGVGQLIIGPALVIETNSTILIEKTWQARVDEYGNLLLNKLV